MRKARVLLVIGVWLAILPYLGFPYSWKGVLTTLTGFGLMYFSYTLYKEYKDQMKRANQMDEETFDNFRENNFSQEEVTEEI